MTKYLRFHRLIISKKNKQHKLVLVLIVNMFFIILQGVPTFSRHTAGGDLWRQLEQLLPQTFFFFASF